MEKRVEFDLDYIENWHLSWDIQIILRTALSLRSSKNAY
jgi:lipopolysaccharide/colanic/teichoic acid biosynthesis glycosyltransferase